LSRLTCHVSLRLHVALICLGKVAGDGEPFLVVGRAPLVSFEVEPRVADLVEADHDLSLALSVAAIGLEAVAIDGEHFLIGGERASLVSPVELDVAQPLEAHRDVPLRRPPGRSD
jgi:hypothetical protein